MKLRDVNLQVFEKKPFHIFFYVFCLHDSFFWRGFESMRLQFLSRSRIEAESSVIVIYLFNYVHLSQLSSCWIWHLTFSWVQLLSNKLEFFVSCNKKIIRTSCSVFGYAHFYKNLTVLHHGDNNFLFSFEICIKFTLLTIISMVKKW